jgi:hypothetical protein
MRRHQQGYIWRKGHNWYGRWWDDVIEEGRVVRKQRAKKLAEYCDRYRTERDVRPLLDEILRPLNDGKTQPEGTLSVAKFVDSYYLPFVEENYKPSTLAGYKNLWDAYLSARLDKIVLRDFRTVDAANHLAEIHRCIGQSRGEKSACGCSPDVFCRTSSRRGTRPLLGGLRRKACGCSPINLAYAYDLTQDRRKRKACPSYRTSRNYPH